MMIPLSRLLPDSSWLDAICADIERDPRLAGIAVDRLEEWEVPLPDMLLLFAGNQEVTWKPVLNQPKGIERLWLDPVEPFTTGLSKEILWRWLQRTEPSKVIDGLGDGRRYKPRWGLALSAEVNQFHGRTNDQWQSSCCWSAPTCHTTEAAAIRDMKRRVLGLFPEVAWRLDNWDEKKWLHTSWTVTAPDLIPPEPVTVRNGEQYQTTPTLEYS